MVNFNSGNMEALKMSLMDSRNSNIPSEEQYFTFTNPKINRSLHVVDADYGVFDSDRPRKNGNFRIKTPRFIKRFQEKEQNNYVVLDDNDDDLKLRPEPELVGSHMSKARFNNAPIKSEQRASSYLLPRLEFDSDSDSFSSSSDSEGISCRSTKLSSNYDRLQSQKSSSSRFFKGRKNDFVRSFPANDGSLNMNHKSRIEAEYDLLKFKAAKYKAERNMAQARLQDQRMASKLREYEYYCVNGIDHRAIEIDSDEKNQRAIQYGRGTYSLQYPQQQSKRKNPFRSGKSSIQPPLQPNFIDNLSQNLPPEVAMFFDYYSDFVPSTASVREFHQAVLSWIYTVPFLSLIYPVLYIIGTIIPQRSSRSWSARALAVGFLDLCILLIAGWAVYNIFTYVFFIISQTLKVAHFFRII